MLVAPGVVTARERVGPVVLAGVVAVVSWHTAWNLGGAVGAVGYAVVVVGGAAVLLPRVVDRLRDARPAVIATLVGLGVAALVAAYLLGPPPALDHALGVGSDRADALGVALARLTDGQYPYVATTYLGNPISPLPGALLLAAPFWWLTGDAGTQNLVWLPALLLVLGGPRAPWRARPALLWALVALGGLEVLREFLVGDDLVTGVVPALGVTAWTLRIAAAASPGVLVTAGIALGVTTCTRPHLALVLVVVVVAVGLRAGRGRALVVGGAAAVTWAALVVPFLLGGAARFSPLHVAAKVTGDREVTVGIVAVAVLAAAAVVLALRLVRPASAETVAWCAAAVLAAPTVLSLLRGMLLGPASEIDLTLGAAAIPFAAWAVASVGSVTSDPAQGWVRHHGGTRPPCDAPRSPSAGTSPGDGGRCSRR